MRTPPRVVEAGKSPVIPNLGSSGSEPSTSSNNTSGTGESERTVEEEEGINNMSETGGRGGRSNDVGKTATPSSTSGIELTELYESEFSFA